MAKKGELTTSDRILKSEFDRLVESLSSSIKESEHKSALTLIAQYYTSLRYSDLEQITIDKVLTQNKITIVEKKTGKSKDVYINKKFKSLVKEIVSNFQIPTSNHFNFYTIQHFNRMLKKFKLVHRLTNSDGDSNFNFSTHSIRKCSLYEIYINAGINTSLAISNHSTIKIHLKYICMNEDVRNAYLSL